MKTVITKDLDPETDEGIKAFLQKAKEYLGKIEYSPDGKFLEKDSFVRLFKYTGDFSKWRNAVNKKEG